MKIQRPRGDRRLSMQEPLEMALAKAPIESHVKDTREPEANTRGGVTDFRLQLARDTNIAVPHRLPSPRGLWREPLLEESPDNARAIGLVRSAKQ